MKFKKPKFWDARVNLFSILLLPFSLIVLLIIFLKKKIVKPIIFGTPIICIGNIYIGGTSKTPTAIFLANKLSKLGNRTVIIRKFYESHTDEYNLIKANFSNLIINKNRVDGIRKAEESNYDKIILDDGFQDLTIKKDVNIVCFNKNQLIGNGLIIPSGPLREGLNSLNNAHIILINGEKDNQFERKILNINKQLKIFYSSFIPENLGEFKGKKLLALAAIANPENFFRLIKNFGLDIRKELIYPDHYEFSKMEVNEILDEVKKNDYQIIMTEKDYFKFNNFEIKNINYLKVSLKINDEDSFVKEINNYFKKN